METKSIDNIALFFDQDERDSAELVGQSCERSLRLIHACWGLDTPEDCRVYVMTTWPRFVFHSAPWPWRILLAASMPLWYFRVKRIWKYAGGWAQQYGKRRAVGVKPPRLMQLADRSMGERIFIKETSVKQKVQHVTCHELVHAFTSHLRLPVWLHEGLAMVTVDKFFEQPTVRFETIEALGPSSSRSDPGTYRSLRSLDRDALVSLYARGYWIARYMEETQPGLLKSMLTERRSRSAWEAQVATALGMRHEEFWKNIGRVVTAHFIRNE